ncbi:ABC transporter permease [Candidatus Zixiibacteriota bacterium]
MSVSIQETGRVAMSSLFTNPLRTLLTSLGIIIGVGAVVGMSSMIEGLDQFFTEQLSDLGSETFYVQARPSVQIQVGGHSNETDWDDLTIDDMTAIERNADSVEMVSGSSTHFGVEIRYGSEKSNPNVILYGGDEYLPRIQGLGLDAGRFFGPLDNSNRRNVVILGADIVERFFPTVDPIGREIRIDSHRFLVIGMLEQQGEFLGFSQDNIVFIPLTTFRKYWGRRSEVQIAIMARPGHLQNAVDETVSILRQRRGVRPGEPNDFEIQTSDSLRDMMNSLILGISLVMVGIASISLLVGGIGIMNIMLVSVTERTKEIGVRKAVGARRRDIVIQFLVEAVVLSGVGGTIGAAIGVGIGLLVGLVTPLPAAVPIGMLVLALFVCGGIGIGFGVYPAMKAARLDPVDALRYE